MNWAKYFNHRKVKPAYLPLRITTASLGINIWPTLWFDGNPEYSHLNTWAFFITRLWNWICLHVEESCILESEMCFEIIQAYIKLLFFLKVCIYLCGPTCLNGYRITEKKTQQYICKYMFTSCFGNLVNIF